VTKSYTKESLTAIERMSDRGSPNLELVLKEGKTWILVLESDQKKYNAVLDAVEFLDYVDPQTAKPFIKETSKLLKYLEVDEYDSYACNIACTASRDKPAAKEMIRELLKQVVSENPADYTNWES
jgi:DNA-directed RNA polymerase sigma subunit (sigma70/sigma32)